MTTLCFIAHPDDETMLCGGTLARLAERGVSVHLACLTRGEGGELGEPPLTDRQRLGQVREQELVCAAQQLGCLPPRFMGYVDPVIGPDETLYAPEHDPDRLLAQIVDLLFAVSPQVVLTHGSNGEYGHPAHLLVHRSVLAAADHPALDREGLPAPAVYSFAAHYPAHPYPRLANADDPADLIVDVSPWLDRKEAAARCHATQGALFVRRRSEAAGRRLALREVLLTEEAFHRHRPGAADPLPAWLDQVTN